MGNTTIRVYLENIQYTSIDWYKTFSFVCGYFYRTLDLLHEMHFLREILADGTGSNSKIYY